MPATLADREAARRILGLPPIVPGMVAPDPPAMTPHGSFRNRKSPSLRDPKRINVDGLRFWTVASESSSFVTYEVTERDDTTKPGGTYFFCTCQSWPTMRGKGRDCKHIKAVVG